jgi:hypothetical protein
MTPRPAAFSGLILSSRLKTLAPRPTGADNIHARQAIRPMGLGASHDATTLPVVGLSWPLSWVFMLPHKGLAPPTTPRRKKRPSYMCAHACARTICAALSWRRGVVSLSIYLKRKKESHDAGHDSATTGCRGWAKPLKTLEKGAFAHG